MFKDVWFPVHLQSLETDCAAESQSSVLVCCVLSSWILKLNPLVKALGLLAGNCE